MKRRRVVTRFDNRWNLNSGSIIIYIYIYMIRKGTDFAYRSNSSLHNTLEMYMASCSGLLGHFMVQHNILD